MERVTRRIGNSIDFIDNKGYAKLSHEEKVRLLFERLAEYEDIGIEPERLKEFLGNFGISIVMKNTKLMNELQEK